MTEGAGEDDILTLFEGFRGELEASNGVREEIKLVTQNMDAETRKMQAALMAIHSGTDQAGKSGFKCFTAEEEKQMRSRPEERFSFLQSSRLPISQLIWRVVHGGVTLWYHL
jgi:hypothetical protein